MNKFTTLRHEVTRDICTALGLDPTKVSRIELVMDVQDVTRIVVTQMVDADEQSELVEVIKKYNLKAGQDIV